jgi:hypothetical protein
MEAALKKFAVGGIKQKKPTPPDRVLKLVDVIFLPK